MTRIAADKLRKMILEGENGAYLGSQDDLVRMLGIGRVTLHQTARILEEERLLRVRRGPNGGYYGTHPDEAGVEKAVALYLRANKADFHSVFEIVTALSVEVYRMAALSQDESARSEFRAVCEQLAEPQVGADSERLLRMENTYLDAIYKLAANPLGELMLRVAYRIFNETAPGNILPRSEDREYWRQTRQKMAQAILDRDADYVQIIGRRFGDYIRDRLSAIRAASDVFARDT